MTMIDLNRWNTNRSRRRGNLHSGCPVVENIGRCKHRQVVLLLGRACICERNGSLHGETRALPHRFLVNRTAEFTILFRRPAQNPGGCERRDFQSKVNIAPGPSVNTLDPE
jgi:hypothetical protein